MMVLARNSVATHDFIFARTSGKDGNARGISCFIVPVSAPGFKVGCVLNRGLGLKNSFGN